MIALYLNVFVLLAQLFENVLGLKSVAPMQSELPFTLAQLFVMAIFVLLGIFAAKKFADKQIRTA